MRKLNESPLKHCYASVLHNPETNKMRQRVSAYGIGTGNDKALADAALSLIHISEPTRPY